MAPPKGNQFWKARSSHGRRPIFESPEKLWDAACEYFQWCEDNPLYESKLVSFQGVSEIEQVPLMRAMTMEGLYLFISVSRQTLIDYENRDNFLAVVTDIKGAIRQQKFEGASAGLLNSNIIARDLGLRDAKELVGAGGGAIKTESTQFTFVPVGPED